MVSKRVAKKIRKGILIADLKHDQMDAVRSLDWGNIDWLSAGRDFNYLASSQGVTVYLAFTRRDISNYSKRNA